APVSASESADPSTRRRPHRVDLNVTSCDPHATAAIVSRDARASIVCASGVCRRGRPPPERHRRVPDPPPRRGRGPGGAGGWRVRAVQHRGPALNEAGDVAFAAAVSGGKTVEGIFATTGRRLRAVAVVGSAAPSIASGTFASLDAPALNDRGDVAFLATVRRGRESIEAIYLSSGATLSKVVAQGDPAPAGGTFAGFGVPALNDSGALAFAAVVEGRAVPGGVFVAKGGRTRMLVGAGDE